VLPCRAAGIEQPVDERTGHPGRPGTVGVLIAASMRIGRDRLESEKRIEALVTNRPKVNLNLSQRTGLVLAGLVAIATSVMLGVPGGSELQAQTQAAPKPDISGTWQGTLASPQAPNGGVRLVFKISTADGDALKALVYAIDRDPTPFSASSITLKGSALQVSIQLLQAAF